ncbi:MULTISPECIES: phage tail tape measure protein [unclassified Roseovarius]|uniref:phage tail tape measure protein n=1 Tax=unclassified Roseovarius TaxID=2614913 RepID=UPI00273D69A1|nr:MULTISPECIES: phage tail tape measure protein [unclassified Roseovarius]
MENLTGLVVDIEARIDKLEKGLARANRAQRRASGQMERRARQSATRLRNTYGEATDGIAASFKKLGPAVVGTLSVAAVSGVARNIRRVVRETASLGDEAERAGLSLQAFQELQFVGSQNRIGMDALTDGLKEMNLRADEFIVTGKGAGAEAFARLGFDASELAQKLKNPSELFLEIVGRLEDLDDAARIRVADEIFGGTGGERFVQLISRGEAALRQTIATAHDTGAVLDQELIDKAAELDRRFDALTTRVANFGKRVAVEVADAGHKIATLRTDLDDLFRSTDQARGLLGDEVSETLAKDSDAVKANKDEINALRRQYEALGDEADRQSAAMLQASNIMRRFGYDEAAQLLADAALKMRDLSGAMQAGEISADEFEHELSKAATTAQTALATIEDVDKAGFSNVIAGIGGLITRLGEAAQKARELRKALPGANSDGSTDGPRNYQGSGATPATAAGNDLVLPQAVGTSVRPRLPSANATFGTPDVSTGGGDSGRSESDYQREIAAIAEETNALRIEAQALADLTGARRRQGDAIEFARTKAELLNAALRSGVADTPELRSQVDQLAGEFVQAGEAAQKAADQIADVQAASRKGAESIADVFAGMATGALSAKEAVGQLILEVIKLSLKKRILEAANGAGGGLFSGFLKILGGGFASGGYTGHGGKHEPAGIVHRGEYVLSKAATSRIGVANLEALHSAAKRGYSGGGLVTSVNIPKGGSTGHSGGFGAAPVVNISAPVNVQGSSGTPEQNQDLAKRMSVEMEKTMRGVVVDEMSRQMRPGNMMARN